MTWPWGTLPKRIDILTQVDGVQFDSCWERRIDVDIGGQHVPFLSAVEVPPPEKIGPVDHKMLLRLCRAELAVATGDIGQAVAEARAGFDELSRVRDRMGGLDLLCGTAVHGWQLGRLALDLMLDEARTQADARGLLEWQERTRAQIYRYEPLPAIDNLELADRMTELPMVLRAVQHARLEGRPVTDLEHRAVAVQREASRLGWHTSQWGKPRPVCQPEEIIDRLGGRALISFASPGHELAAVVVADGRTDLVRLGAAAEVLETAKQMHADLNALAPDDLIPVLAAVVSASANRRITRMDEMMRPLVTLVGDRDMVIVPDGDLYQVPWSALSSLRGRAVSVTPSATTWVQADAAQPSESSKVVLVGGPGLPNAISELHRLHEIYPQAIVLDGEQATADAVMSAMDGAYLVHFAAHGTHEPTNALFSRLELADRGLLAHELSQLHRAPEHVVFAACELALNYIRLSDEPLGFATAMLASGSRTVITALTRVGGRRAAETMTEYHHRFASGMSPAVALAETIALDPLRRPFTCLGAG